MVVGAQPHKVNMLAVTLASLGQLDAPACAVRLHHSYQTLLDGSACKQHGPTMHCILQSATGMVAQRLVMRHGCIADW